VRAYLTSEPFFGRKTDIQTIKLMLRNRDCRLLTIAGVGGIGKTRLAIEIMHQLQNVYDQVYFVDIHAIDTAQGLYSQLIETLDIHTVDSHPMLNQICNWLSDRHILIVLDNFEHLVAERDILAQIIAQTDETNFLITSRQTLKLNMEYVHYLDGLNTKNGTASSSVSMFIEFAKRRHLSFDIQEEEVDTIKICQFVDGMPLAIQLASSWVASMSCATIFDQIKANHEILSSQHADIPKRHQSITACFDISWNLLTTVEQQALAKLSIFEGGFTVEAAQQIADANAWILRSLTEKSLIQYDRNLERYYIHELMRQYSYTKLSLSADFQATENAYMRHYANLLATWTHDLKVGTPQAKNKFITAKFNIINSWNLAIRDGNSPILEQMWEGLFQFFVQKGNYQEGEEIFQRLLDAGDTIDADMHLIGLTFTAWFIFRRGQIEAARKLIEQQPIERSAREKPEILHLVHYAHILVISGQYDEAHQLIPDSIAAAEYLDDDYYHSFALYNYGYLLSLVGQIDEAINYINRSIALSRRLGQEWGTALSLIVLSTILERSGQYDDALEHLKESYTVLVRTQDYWGIVFSLSYLSRIMLRKKDYKQAYHYLQQAWSKAKDSANMSIILGVILDTAFYMKETRQFHDAIALATYVQHHKATYSIEQHRADELLEQLATLLSRKFFDSSVEAGLLLSPAKTHNMIDQLEAIVPNQDALASEKLTPRELEILQLIADGLSNHDIAEHFIIAEGTVKRHVFNLYQKLNVNRRAHAINTGRDLGLIQ